MFRYDAFRYESHAAPAMHPDRLFTLAALFGLPAAPADRCRYLEVGAGDGTNLIAAAVALPGGTFVGLDLAETAVARGNDLIHELGLTNARLLHADLTTWRPDAPFDYVVAHGVYSWVPADVRDALVGLVKAALGPSGVGYVSYNTLPGCHLRRVIWDLLKFHTADVPDPGAKLDQAAQVLQFLIAGQHGVDAPPNRLVLAEAKSVLDRPERHLTFHDDLSEFNDPVYFLDFANHLDGHGLKFLAEADLPAMSDESFPKPVAQALAALHGRSPLLQEQYRDFLRVRRFRRSLVCHADRPTRATPDPAAAAGLWASTRLRPADPAAEAPAEFVGGEGGSVEATDPATARLLARLAAVAPERLAVRDLAGPDPAAVDGVLAVARAGLIALHGQPGRAVRAAGDRPAVSPLARWQAARGPSVSTLLHTTVELTDPPTRTLVPLLDGTRTRDELAAAVRAAVPTLGTPEEVRDGLDIHLDKLARLGLLTG